ncbi:MAG: hypothetical protein ACRD5K_00965 [Candidatus Acidiferrales bacterium]
MNQLARWFCIAASFAFLMARPSWAQKTEPPPSQSPGAPPSAQSSIRPSVSDSRGPSFVYGSIITENGLAVPNSVAVKLSCGDQLVQAIHPDLNGNFQFDLQGGEHANADMNPAVNTSVQRDIIPLDSPAASVGPGGSGPPLAECELEVSAPGYRPLSKIILVRIEQIGGVDAGALILTPTSGAPGSAVSANSLRAPKNARKEFQKGLNDIRHNKSQSAIQHLEKAVAEYDSYAAAWDDLGRLYAGKHENHKARQAFSKAIASDSEYLPPYVSLADLQLQDGQFQDAADTAGKALAIAPGLIPASFIEAAADFRLHRLDAAEGAARFVEGAPQQKIPQVHVLLADILLQRDDYSSAVEEMRAYLKEAPQGEFAANAKKSLEQIERLSLSGRPGPAGLAPPSQPPVSQLASPKRVPLAVLEVSLRLPGDSRFAGAASIRVTSPDGRQLADGSVAPDGDNIFRDVPPGTYTVEARAPGFVTIRKRTDIDAGGRLRTLFFVMQPTPLPGTASAPSVHPASLTFGGSPTSWIPRDIDSSVPQVQPGAACRLSQVIGGVSRRMTQFVETLQQFDATEHLEQFDVLGNGSLSNPQTRTFDYVAVVKRSSAGVISVDEYRNGSMSPVEFPGHVATTGLTAMALIFHPRLVSDFDFTCEGLGRWDGQPAWQIHFAQRPDQLNEIRAYVVAQNYYPVPLKGRVWIDAATYQVRHLESELMRPVPKIGLTHEYMAIDYGRVEFYKHTRQLWLPLDAQLYWEQHGRRFYRHHTFSNFKLFQVSVAQDIQPPKESYCFTNTSDRDIAGRLTVSPVPGVSASVASVDFTIPVGARICRIIGPGKGLNIPANDVGSAVFTYDGPAGSVAADATLLNGNSLDLVPNTSVASRAH